MEVGVGMCLMGVNVLLYSRKFDQIMARHNALTQQERSRGRMRMWIYVLITLVSTIGLFTFIELTREKPETESLHDKARIEIPKLHISDISK